MRVGNTWGMPNPKTKKTPDELLTFWQRLVKASEWKGIPCSPGDIAKELGVYPSAVSKYVDGKYPKKDNINRLAIKRGVRAEWLLSGQGQMVAEEALDDETQDMLRIWNILPDDAKQRLLANMRYEHQAASTITTGRRQILTDELIRLLEMERKPQ